MPMQPRSVFLPFSILLLYDSCSIIAFHYGLDSSFTLSASITEIVAHAEPIDRNHLLEAGLEGFYGSSRLEKVKLKLNLNTGTNFIENASNQIPKFDFATNYAYLDQ
ncbi:hypothetical protein KSS87_008902 [Heliosperma pusillum]|nr:hypothetical protein KSS87_008902 [Heliosperma pusillum]